MTKIRPVENRYNPFFLGLTAPQGRVEPGNISFKPERIERGASQPLGLPPEARISLMEKYGNKQLDPAIFAGAREKHMNGRSLLPEGALGNEGAINGAGASLNFFA